MSASHEEVAELRRALETKSAELARSLARLHEVEQSHHDLVHMAAHDLRSPLMIVSGYLELLAEGDAAVGTRADFIRRAREGVPAILQVIDALLDLSRLESNQAPLEVREHAVAPLVDRALDMLGPLAVARIERDLVPPALSLRCDGPLISRVVANLLVDALKFSEEPDTVRLSVEETSRDSLRIHVDDRGQGAPVEPRSRLFEKRATDMESRPRGRSSGLGLAFCRLAVEAHDGEIGCREDDRTSSPSRYWVELPRQGPRHSSSTRSG